MNSRKEEILKAIIWEYIRSAEPVSSKAIMSEYDLNVSSATIRNEMAALEKMGYITQTHTSSGRIPVALGYRYYVDYLMGDVVREDSLVRQIRGELSGSFIEKMGSVISSLTNYTVFITEEKKKHETIHHIKLVGLVEDEVLLVVVLSTRKVKNFLIPFMKKVREDQLFRLSKVLTDHLKDQVIVTPELRQKIKSILKDEDDLLDIILTYVESALRENIDKELLVEGIQKIFRFPEFDEVKKVESFMTVLEEKDLVLGVLDDMGDEGVSIKIGEEIGHEELLPYTLLATSYTLDDFVEGKIGIIGPTRMFYEKNIQLLEAALDAIKVQENEE